MLALGAGGGCFYYHLPLFLCFSYRLKYFLKGPLKPKQQQQHKFNFGYSLTELNCQCKMANIVGLDQTALYEYYHLELHYSQRHLSRY